MGFLLTNQIPFTSKLVIQLLNPEAKNDKFYYNNACQIEINFVRSDKLRLKKDISERYL